MDVHLIASSPQEHLEMMEKMMFLSSCLSSSDSSMLSGYNFIQDSANGNIASNVATSNFGNGNEISFSNNSLHKRNSTETVREMIFRVAMMQPIHIDPESVKPPKRKNVKISKDPQSVTARHRRERVSEKIRILQRLVPGGTKMDTASMLDEAVHYLKFLKKQVDTLQKAASDNHRVMLDGYQASMSSMAMNNYSGLLKNCQPFNIMASNASMQMLS